MVSCYLVQTMQSAVGIHIGVTAVTWAQIDCSGKLLHWDLYSLEFGPKKLHLSSLFDVVSHTYHSELLLQVSSACLALPCFQKIKLSLDLVN